MSKGQLGGWVMIRPVRLGLLVGDGPQALTDAVHCATSAWGGMYTPFLNPADPDQAKQTADALSVDALWANNDDGSTRELTSATGYRWREAPTHGPYDAPIGYRASRLLTAERFLGSIDPDIQLVQYQWAPTDPLGLLFGAWFGEYGPSEFDRELERRFLTVAESVEIAPGGVVPAGESSTSISLTAAHINYTGETTFDGFVVMDPTVPAEVLRFWNARAYGGRVFPWPVGHSPRITEAAHAWLERVRTQGILNRWRRGDGTPLPARISVLLRASDTAVPQDLLDVLAAATIDPFPEHEVTLTGWTGSHPMQTSFSRTFSVEVAQDDWRPTVPLPALPLGNAHGSPAPEMVVAAQISFSTERDPTTTRWATLPNLRALAELFNDLGSMAQTHRPAYDGRVVAVSTTDMECPVALIPAHAAVAALFEDSPWRFEQSENGIFATRLGTIFGGPDVSAPMEPAIREVLAKVVRAPRGKLLPQLEQIARKHSGNWPDDFLFAQDASSYVRSVPLRLLNRKLLRPYLYVQCPECTIPAAVRPEELESEVTCTMCSARYQLGFAIAHRELETTWRYRTPPDIDNDRLLEAVALLATRGALRGWDVGGRGMPHMFGVKLSATETALRRRADDPSCELDLLLMSDFQGVPQLIAGEVKHRGPLEEADLENMRAVQAWFAEIEIDCWPLFATLRPALEPREVELLRNACETVPRARGSMIVPKFPIVLLEQELSAPWMDDNSLVKWSSTRSPGDLGIASCTRNLGLESWAPSSTLDSWVCKWRADAEPVGKG